MPHHAAALPSGASSRYSGCAFRRGDTMRATTLAAITVTALALGACGGPKGPPGKSAAELLAELPAPYNTGDVEAGKQVFAQCAACHTIGDGQPSTVGPNLHGVF